MKLTLIALALSALVMPLHAKDGGGGHHRDARKRNPQAAFHRKDKDHNGQLSEQEFTAGAKNEKRAEKRFKKEDSDSSGSVSRKEFRAGAAKEGHGGKHKGKEGHKSRHQGKRHK